MLERYQAPFSLRVFELAGVGCGEARTNGAARASGKMLLFLDDDLEAAPSLIEAHMAAHDRRPGEVVVGCSPPVVQEEAGFLRQELEAWWRSKFESMRRPGRRTNYRDLLGGNLSLEAELFSRMDGFDPAFSPLCFEDYEFGVRLIKAGIRFTFVPEALAHHHEHETVTIERFFHRKEKEGRADVLIGRRHPELRPLLPLAGLPGARYPIDRILCFLAFVFPAASDRLWALIRRALDPLERAKLLSLWRLVFCGIHRHRYWRGVAQEIGSLKALSDFLAGREARSGQESPAESPTSGSAVRKREIL
jgi:GT2 family glycosyltransferase